MVVLCTTRERYAVVHTKISFFFLKSGHMNLILGTLFLHFKTNISLIIEYA